MLFNARSLCNKLSELSELLLSDYYDFVFVTETWLNPTFTDASLCFGTNYSVFRSDRNGIGGGVCIFKKIGIATVEIDLPEKFSALELIALDVFLCKCKYRLICAYRSPSTLLLEQRAYISLFCEYLTNLCDVVFPVILTGDFNLPHLNWNVWTAPSDGIHDVFANTISQCKLEQLVLSPTRNDNILDLVFVNDRKIVGDVIVSAGFSTSDHNCVEFSLLGQQLAEPKNFQYRNFRLANYNAISAYLATIDWVRLFFPCYSADQYWAVFRSVLQNAIDLFVPLCCTKRRAKNYPRYITRLNAAKRTAWRRRFRSGGADMYKRCAAKYKRAVENLAHNRERSVLLSGNVSAFYRFVNSKISSKRGIGPLKRVDGTLAISDVEKSEILNAYFASVFTVDNSANSAFPLRTNEHMSFVIFDIDSIKKVMVKLSSSIACGPGGLQSLFFRNLAHVLAKPLSLIFEVSFCTGCLPSVWLEANVCPIYKKNDCRLPENHRPVSLTCVGSKIMETVIRDKLLDFLLTNNLISNAQFGFMPRRSTCLQLIDCVNIWANSLNNSKCVDVVYLDFSKAFDKVSHIKLVSKLVSYGVSGCLLKWLTSFLYGRKQRVVVNGCFSDSRDVVSGVPQGSVLGPLLFVIYINDMCDFITNTECRLFADDAKMFEEFDRRTVPANLQSNLNRVYLWSLTWQLPLALTKCSVLHLGYNNPRNVYYLGTHQLKSASSMRDLGVIISDSLHFHEHSMDIAAKAYKRINLLFRVFSIREPKVLVRAYITYVRPILEYCSSVWSPYHLQDITALEKVQRYFTRRLFYLCNFPQSDYEHRLLCLNLDSLEIRRLRFDLCLCFQIVKGFVDFPMNCIFQFSTVQHTRGHSLKLELNYSRINVHKNTFANRVVAVWNSLPDRIVSTNTVTSFRAQIQRIIV